MNTKFSRSGIEYIIGKYADEATKEIKHLKEKKVTPHVFRHSKGMHLMGSDVNIVYIRDLFGHSSVQVTERYARADSRAKRAAIEKASQNIIPESVYTSSEKQGLAEYLKTII